MASYIEDCRYVPAEYNIPNLLGAGTVQRGNRLYISKVTAFDIEASNIKIGAEKESIMYVWMFQYEDVCYVGRTWDAFRRFLSDLDEQADMMAARLVVYVHNLSYEYQFLRTVLDFRTEDVFCVKSRRILRAIWHNIEFRCSYIHSNMSLAEYTTKMQVFHVKQSGEEFDYTKERYPWTPLSKEELKYCIWDVRGLVECIEKDMEVDGDDIGSIPLTSTGYVRRDVKRALPMFIRKQSKAIMPGYDVYKLARDCFRGGNTHANRYYAGEILHNIWSYDRCSSYPDVQVNDVFPVTMFKPYLAYPVTDSDIDRLINKRGKALMFRAHFEGICLKDKWFGCPYLSLSKCTGLGTDVSIDNGRVLESDQLTTALTDIDWRIVCSQYTWDAVHFSDIYTASYGKLPAELLDVVRDYFYKKTTLKGVTGQEIFYMKSKNKLNAIYGMTAQDPGKVLILDKGLEYVMEDKSLEEAYEEGRKKALLPYTWGVWTTAWARYRLEEGIRLAGDDFVYCDTDSVKSVSPIDFASYNAEREAASRKNKGTAKAPDGTEYYLGVYEEEGCYDRFITWGAKKYAFEQNGRLGLTISGVRKNDGAAELVKHGGLDKLRPGYTFKDAGGVELKYNDHAWREVDMDGHRLELPSNVVILPSTYKLSLTEEYKNLIGYFEDYY